MLLLRTTKFRLSPLPSKVFLRLPSQNRIVTIDAGFNIGYRSFVL